MATFWVDDGATSAWLGPLLVGVQRRRDGCIEVGRIGPELLMDAGDWGQLVMHTTGALLDRLGARPGDTVLLCRGSLFHPAARHLAALGFRVERGVITGRLQTRLALLGRQDMQRLTGQTLGTAAEQLAWVAADPVHRLCHMRARFRDRLTSVLIEAVAAAECAVAGV